MDRIINEFRVIETDDGFRIEIKGDKERIKSFMGGFGRHRRWHGPFGFGFAPWLWMKAASCWGSWDIGSEEGEEAGKTSEA
jgi:hypothetical protein